MLDALLATIGTLGILASLACKLRGGADLTGTVRSGAGIDQVSKNRGGADAP